jgi:hypothetical protein
MVVASINPALVQGFVWFVFRDPGQDENEGPDHPFADDSGLRHLWWIEGTEDRIRNPIWGDSYLMVTEKAELPRVERGWAIEPADLDEGFQNLTGDVRLNRLMSVRRTPWGIVQEGDFVVTETDPATRQMPRPDALLHALLNGGMGSSSEPRKRFRAAGEDWPT